LPRIEHGVGQSNADPIELVMAFRPWLQEAKDKVGPHLASISHGDAAALRSLLHTVIDSIERVYAGARQSCLVGLAQLDGLDDMLVGLSFAMRRN
jgi:hypothetical protein